ncbi:putative Hydrolase [Magnetospira sp. QH-2]|nr:putative Hydrolase [Magnetospira sp. QH-2]
MPSNQNLTPHPSVVLPGIRNGLRAVIRRDDKILMLRKSSSAYGERYVLPGGTQDPGETIDRALNRECREEIGTGVEIIALLHVADFFKPRDTDPPTYRHQIEFLLSCRVPESYQATTGSKPDRHQVGVVWLPLDNLAAQPVFPCQLVEILRSPPSAVYLGRID